MRILHILKKAPDASTQKLIELQKAGQDVKVVELYKGGIAYDKLVADVFSYDKVFCW